MGFSIIIPVKEINDYIRESVPITLQLDYDQFEIIIIPNELPNVGLPDYLSHPKVRLLASGKVSPALKRDMGARIARYDFLAFLDDDAYPRADWLTVAARYFLERDVDALGGPGVTPPNSTLGELASGLFYETLVGGGGLAYRYRPCGEPFFVDDYPTVNLIVKKTAFEAVGGFDNAFWPGEDTKFCLDFVNAGYRILYVPDLVVWHHRRSLLRPHLKQVGGYGLHRGFFAKRFPRTSARPTYFAPSAFLLGNIGLFGLSLWNAEWLKLWGAAMTVYLTLALVDVFRRTQNVALGLLTVLTIFCSHLTYGFMFLRGFFAKTNFKSQLR